MPERVYVSAANLKCPGASDLAGLADLAAGRARAPLERVCLGDEEVMLGETLELDRSSPYYPTRSKEKVMRREVIAATMCVAELLEGLELPASAMAEIPLFVASGMSFERQGGDADWFVRASRALNECSSTSERNRRLGQLTPPLLALRTLTNATSSFIAEQTRVTGNNATFGVTSLSGFHALQEGWDAVRSGQSAMAIVGGASRGGVGSFFMYRNFFRDAAGWKESIATAFLLLESGASLQARGASPLCELVLLRNAALVPTLTGHGDATPFERFAEFGSSAPLAVYGGAFCVPEHVRLTAAVASWWPRAVSLFDALGNTGVANVFLDILTGVALSGAARPVDCLDRDPYSRECLVRITPYSYAAT
jgi:hypothetical protein